MNRESTPPSALETGFRVGEWQVNPRQETICRGAESRHIEHKVMQTLVQMAERANQVVTRAEFLNGVWQGRVVNEEALSRAVSLLRTALDDDAHEPRYIQTIPRTGYRLIAEVHALAHVPETQQRREWLFASDSLAVLPFASLDGVDNEYLSAGLTEELSTALAKVPGLRVVSTTWARGLTPDELRQRAKVRAFTEGTVRQRGDKLRITVRLIDVDSGVQSWTEVYERAMQDIFELQNEIAGAIVTNLGGSLGVAPRIEPASADTDAYQSFLLGRYHIERRGAENIRRGILELEQALARDPKFIRAHLLRADAYALLPSYAAVDEHEMLERAGKILDHVSELSGSADASHRLRAFIYLRRGEWIAAEEEFRRAQAVAPADVETLRQHAVLLAAVGHLHHALKESERAVAIEPLSPIANHQLAWIHAWLGHTGQGSRYAKLAIELGLDPLVDPELRLLMMFRNREFDSLNTELQDLQRNHGGAVSWIAPWVDALANPDPTRIVDATTALDEAYRLGGVAPRLRFGASMLLGSGDATLAAARELVRTGHLPDAIASVYSPEGAPVRRQPGFMDLARDTGLAAFWDRYGQPSFIDV